MALSAKVAIMGTDESFQVLFGDLPKHQTCWVWGEVTACRLPGMKGVCSAEFPEKMDMLVICIVSLLLWISFLFYLILELPNSLNGSWFKDVMLEVRNYFEAQGKGNIIRAST